jgi:hypothetical protein
MTHHPSLRRGLGTVRSGLSKVAAAQERVSTRHRVDRHSDCPTLSARVLAKDSGLPALTDYATNIAAARECASVEETALDQASRILNRTRERREMQDSALEFRPEVGPRELLLAMNAASQNAAFASANRHSSRTVIRGTGHYAYSFR